MKVWIDWNYSIFTGNKMGQESMDGWESAIHW